MRIFSIYLKYRLLFLEVIWILGGGVCGENSCPAQNLPSSASNVVFLPPLGATQSVFAFKGMSNVSFKLGESFRAVTNGQLVISSIVEDHLAISIMREHERFVCEPASGLIYTDPRVSQDGRHIFFLVRSYKGWGTSSGLSAIALEYYGIGEFELPELHSSVSNTMHRVVLPSLELRRLLNGRGGWVDSIRDISPDGRHLLLDVKVERSVQGSKRIEYPSESFWYSLKEGLPNGITVSKGSVEMPPKVPLGH